MQENPRKSRRNPEPASKRKRGASIKTALVEPTRPKRTAEKLWMTERRAVAWPKAGMPGSVTVDNGVSWRRHLGRQWRAYGISIHHIPPRCPNFKGLTEKYFQELCAWRRSLSISGEENDM